MTNVKMVQAAAQTTAAKASKPSQRTDTDFASLLGQKASATSGKKPESQPDKVKPQKDKVQDKDTGQDKDDALTNPKQAEAAVQEEVAVLTEPESAVLVDMQAKFAQEAGQLRTLVQEVQPEGSVQPEKGILTEALMQTDLEQAVQPEIGAGEAHFAQALTEQAPSQEIALNAAQAEPVSVQAEPVLMQAEAVKVQPAETKGAEQTALPENEKAVPASEENAVHGLPKSEEQPEGQGEVTENHEEASAEDAMAEARGSGNAAADTRSVSFTEPAERPSEPVRTTSADLPQDLGRAIADRMPRQNGELTIELEPRSLGKIIVKVAYEGDRASVSLMATNERTLELLSRSAGNIAGIIEEKTGQETLVYTPQREEPPEQEERGRQPDGREQEQKRERKKEETESFLQQIRLGLV